MVVSASTYRRQPFCTVRAALRNSTRSCCDGAESVKRRKVRNGDVFASDRRAGPCREARPCPSLHYLSSCPVYVSRKTESGRKEAQSDVCVEQQEKTNEKERKKKAQKKKRKEKKKRRQFKSKGMVHFPFLLGLLGLLTRLCRVCAQQHACPGVVLHCRHRRCFLRPRQQLRAPPRRGAAGCA